MPWDGFGGFDRVHNWVNDRDASIDITASRFDAENDDFASGIENCVTKDGQTVSPILVSPIVNEILDSNSNELLEFGATPSAVNNLKIINNITGATPVFEASGEANIGIIFRDSNANDTLRLSSVASAVNWIDIENSATGNEPTIKSEGEADKGIIFRDSNNALISRFRSEAGAINRPDLFNSATTPGVVAAGTDTNIDLSLAGKGTGGVAIAQDKLKIGGTIVTATAAELNNTSAIVPGSAVATTSGTTAAFTAIPSWVKKITVSLFRVSTSGTNIIYLQLGDSGGYENTGYFGFAADIRAASTNYVKQTTGFPLNISISNPEVSGNVTLINEDGNNWTISGSLGENVTGGVITCGGAKTLTATLDRVQLFIAANAFDNGSVNILYEG